MTAIRMVRAEGDLPARGRHIGRELGDLIERSLGFYRGYMERRGVRPAELQDVLTPYLAAAEESLPREMAMLKSIAEGAMVPVWELFAVNAFEELEPLLEPPRSRKSFLERDAGPGPRPIASRCFDRCSTFSVHGADYTLLGHNEQWLAGDAGNVATVVEIPDDGSPSVASPGIVCCLPSVGLNENGAAVGIQSLVAFDDGVGVPRAMVSRHTLDAVDRADAMRRVRFQGRAGGYGYVWAFATGDACQVETTATRVSLLEGAGPHTNHYLDPALATIGAEPSAGSVARYNRMLHLIENLGPSTPEDVMTILRDHDSEPQSICLHPDPREGEEAAAVVFSMVCDVEHGRMWVAAGNPCQETYEEVDLLGVVQTRL